MKNVFQNKINKVSIASFFMTMSFFSCCKAETKNPNDVYNLSVITIPKKYKSTGVTPESFIITKENHAENQGRNQCAACASAFILRHYDEDATGSVIYENYPSKRSNGTINPRGIDDFFNSTNKYNAVFNKGSIDELKNAVSKGIPQIVFIKCTGGTHYVPVVGYSKEYIYIQESVPEFRNASEKYYNRRIPIKEFKKLWHPGYPFCSNMFITVIQK
jgi:hypothetical protein